MAHQIRYRKSFGELVTGKRSILNLFNNAALILCMNACPPATVNPAKDPLCWVLDGVDVKVLVFFLLRRLGFGNFGGRQAHGCTLIVHNLNIIFILLTALLLSLR